MRATLSVLLRDLRGVRTNVMTAIVVFGLVIIPTLFSSFNVLASWDPFSNTDRLEIAVASTDDGYDSDLVKLNVNLGDQVLSQLSRNDQIDWVITDEEKAVDGTKSGDYYAAIVLPHTFSADMLTFYVAGTEPTKLTLYTNEKKNALSTIIAPQGAEGVVTQINDTFTRVLSNVGLGLVSSLSDYLSKDDTKAAVDRIEARVREVGARLHSGAGTARALGALIDSTTPLIDSAGNIVRAAGAQFTDPSTAVSDGTSAATDLGSILEKATGGLDAVLNATGDSYGVVGDRIDDLFSNADTAGASTAATVTTLAQRVQDQVDRYTAMRAALDEGVGNALPEAARPGYDRAVGYLDTAIARSQDLHDSLARTAQDITDGKTSAQDARQRSSDAVTRARNAVTDAVDSYRQDLRPQLSGLGTSLQNLGNDVSQVKEDLGDIGATVNGSSGSVRDTLASAGDSVRSFADKLDDHARRFGELENALENAGSTGDFSKLRELVGTDPETLSSQLAEPVGVDREAVFPVSTFGAGMTPLYTVLALWIGALLSAVIIRIDPGVTGTKATKTATEEAEPEPEESGLTRAQSYFGHFGIFAVIGLAQSTLAVLSLLVFVQIDAAHPFLLLVSGWVISLVFMLLIYTLVLSFGSAGKAIAVFLLVVQVSGAGGAYPLPLLPQWFQSISPWLPATHGISAMRSAIAGMYQGDLWIELGLLTLFVIPTLLLGLVLRKLLDGYNRKTITAIESTKVMST